MLFSLNVDASLMNLEMRLKLNAMAVDDALFLTLDATRSAQRFAYVWRCLRRDLA